jgi:hypothetical protein
VESDPIEPRRSPAGVGGGVCGERVRGGKAGPWRAANRAVRSPCVEEWSVGSSFPASSGPLTQIGEAAPLD